MKLNVCSEGFTDMFGIYTNLVQQYLSLMFLKILGFEKKLSQHNRLLNKNIQKKTSSATIVSLWKKKSVPYSDSTCIFLFFVKPLLFYASTCHSFPWKSLSSLLK